uniref:Uncharacterized protein n=1 Tax=Vannella robusta TaxID=1487602 RepID=A0A7S4MKI5_9EUKA|mmetsp:Transcript_24867/g.31648  ORF Transcript_24867/g.31648 Transcript_24867/m.31648 type:complete len:258 (+) Transcript_24867:288-1061(+)
MPAWTYIHKWIVRNGDYDNTDYQELEKHQTLNISLSELTEYGASPLHLAVLHDEKLVFHLLRNGIDINHQNKRGETALHWAAHARKLDNVRILLQYGADLSILDEEENSCLHWTAASGGSRTAKILLSHNESILNMKNKEGNTPLAVAIQNEEFVVAKFLLKAGAEYSEVLLEQTNQKNYEAVKILIRYGTNNDKNFQDSYLRNPLHYAALHNHYRLVKLLCEYQPEWKKAKDVKGFLPSRFCHTASDQRIITMLNQ